MIDPSVIVKDLSLSLKDGDEYEAFGSEPELWVNLRSGNTVLQMFDPNNYENLVKTVVARKGLNKFFDIRHEYISREDRYNEEGVKKYDRNVKNMILAPVKKALLEGHKVEVIKTLKANGENVQISYLADLGAWIIASKNVGLIARDVEDLELYQQRVRYNFAYLMARCWFTMISELTKK